MTRVTGSAFDAATLKILDKAGVLTIAQQDEVLDGSQGLKFLAIGKDFGNYDPQGFAHSGTMTEFEIAHGDGFIMEWTGMNVPIADFWAAVKTGNLDAVQQLVFSGDDLFDIVGSINGAPAPVYNGLGGDDVFHLNLSLHGQAVVLNGGDGNDTFNLDNNFDAATCKIDGGAEFDVVNLTGGSAADLTMGATSMVNVEKLVLGPQAPGGAGYTITMNDANVAAGATLTVDATSAGFRGLLNFNGSAESNGAFNVLGSIGNDVIVGGRGADTEAGNGGADTLTGGQGADHFVFSGVFGQDVVKDFTATGTAHDVIQLDAAEFANFQAVQAHMTQVGADTVITLDASDSITLQHVTASSLTAADFLFI